MIGDPEFVIGLAHDNGPGFVIYDRCPAPTATLRLRSTLEQHRDRLRLRLYALERLLATDAPERAERLMVDGTAAKVERIVLRPGPDDQPRCAEVSVNAISSALASANGKLGATNAGSIEM